MVFLFMSWWKSEEMKKVGVGGNLFCLPARAEIRLENGKRSKCCSLHIPSLSPTPTYSILFSYINRFSLQPPSSSSPPSPSPLLANCCLRIGFFFSFCLCSFFPLIFFTFVLLPIKALNDLDLHGAHANFKTYHWNSNYSS